MRLIDADKLKQHYAWWNNEEQRTFDQIVDAQPTVDAVPVVHGKWIPDGDGYHWTYNCSICGWKDGYPFNERHNYCPQCGARMDGDGNE